MHKSRYQLEEWKKEIESLLNERLRLKLHQDKSRIINLSKVVDFVGFRNFYYFKLLRKRNIKNMQRKISDFNKGKFDYFKLFDSFQGWNAYASWANSSKLAEKLIKKIRM